VSAPDDEMVGHGPPEAAGTGRWTRAPRASFCHHGLLFEGEDQYVEVALDFLREGVRQGDQVLVLADPRHLPALRDAVGPTAPGVRLTDTGPFGWNPARALPVWRDFIDGLGPEDRARGLAEPVSAAGHPLAAPERAIHESLLNLAFADSHAFWLVCPYDTSELAPALSAQVGSSHPFMTRNGELSSPSPTYRSPEADHIFGPSAGALDPPPPGAEYLTVGRNGMGALRRWVRARADEAGLSDARADDFALAVHELVANSVRHGGGHGRVAVWPADGMLVCEVADSGRFDAPLAGRIRPSSAGAAGRGLWIVNQLCDLVQIRSVPDGTVVRVHISVDPSPRPAPR
jgi:anti-sigma regulatory factor (Ser/Thr protein kinase)